MKVKIISVLLVSMLALNLVSCKSKDAKVPAASNEPEKVKIDRHPHAADFGRGKAYDINKLKNENSKFKFDFRGYDVESLDLSGLGNELLNSIFDSKTKWPAKLPQEFNPDKQLEFHKNPGLGIRKLHEQGITGKGVNIAFIDYALLVEHKEYSDRVKMYEEIHYNQKAAQMHAPAVASIAAGKNTGVAPEANIYFIASENYEVVNNQMGDIDFTWTAKSIERIIEVNKSLPQKDKIRILSISAGWQPGNKGYKEVTEAVDKAIKEGIFVITVNMFETYKDKFYFHGLDIDTFADKDNASNYKVTEWNKWTSKVGNIDGLSKYYEEKISENKPKELLLIPIDSKTVASPTGDEDYVFYREGGWSWCMPYIAGLYALACQVDTKITPEVFWREALATGDSRVIERGAEKYTGKIVNPEKLLMALKKGDSK